MKMTKMILAFAALLALSGCAYKGGRVVDGTNLEIGIAVPGTDGMLTIDALSYTAGLKVCGADKTTIVVSNDVSETNSYFGVVKTNRKSKMTARIEPCYYCYNSSTNDVKELKAKK